MTLVDTPNINDPPDILGIADSCGFDGVVKSTATVGVSATFDDDAIGPGAVKEPSGRLLK